MAAAKQAIAAAGHVPVDMADIPAVSHPAAQVCAELVRTCDVYVGVLGTRYGSLVQDRPEVSYTELEFDTATEAGMDRLVFLLDTDAADVGIPPSALIDREFGDCQDTFRRRVRDRLVTASFASPDGLGQLVERSLTQLADTWRRTGSGMDSGQAPATKAGSRPPASLPRVWNVPPRNPRFTGRDGLLVQLREALVSGDRAVVQALHGIGGVGKSQLAAEYAYRFAGAYELAWWIDAEQAGLIGDQFAALGAALGCVGAGASTEMVHRAVLGELRERGRWLLVFDNAQTPGDLAAWLPGGGHVLITSRQHLWAEIAVQVDVDVLARAESVAILTGWVSGLTEADARRLAAELGDLPLAVAQAAEYLAETGMPAADYLTLLRTRVREILDLGRPVSHPMSLVAVTQLAADELARDDPHAAELADLCAFLGPEPVPGDLLTGAGEQLPPGLAARAADPMAWRQTLVQVNRHALARVDHRGLQMHRLTQAILRDRLSPVQAAATRERAEAILVANNPCDPANPATWPRWAQLMPHLLAADLAATANYHLRWLACHACWYLMARGDAHSSHALASKLYPRWRERLGSDDDTVLEMAHMLAMSLQEMGHYTDARDLDQDNLINARRVLGEDHHNTLVYANSLAMDLYFLGEVRAACDLLQDTVHRYRRVLGEDHLETLRSTSNLAMALRDLGDVHAALNLNLDTMERRCRVLGVDHPETLASATGLATALRDLGQVRAARDLDQDILARRRRVLGEDHPDTLNSASNLALNLFHLGEVRAARDLDQDTVARKRRVLGEDHPLALRTAINLANDLRALGDVEAARDLDQDILARYRRILGEDHPDTLASASNLATDLRVLEEVRGAHDLDQDTLASKRRVLGEDHPSTLRTAINLATDLRALGEVRAARDLDQDTLARSRRILGEDHFYTLRTASNLAIDLRLLGEAGGDS